MSITLLHGDCRDILPTLPERSVQCIVTSPPYYGLRRYDVDGAQIGLEQTPAEYVAALVDVFRACRRVLRDDGVLWVNLGDSYVGGNQTGRNDAETIRAIDATSGRRPNAMSYGDNDRGGRERINRDDGIPQKNLLGIPWRVAFALQDDGWILRSDIIWAKPNPMPESVTDRPTRAHEYLFLFAKSPRYYYDSQAIAEPVQQSSLDRINQPTFDEQTGGPKDYANGTNPNRSMRKTLENFAKGKGGRNAFRGQGHFRDGENGPANRDGRDMRDVGAGPTRNRRTVWTIATRPYSGAHFAVFPEQLVEPCILAGSAAQACEHCGAPWERVTESERLSDEKASAANKAQSPGVFARGGNQANFGRAGDYAAYTLGFRPTCQCPNTGAGRSVVLDPFCGSGTTMRVAERYGRDSIGIDLGYADLQEQRTDGVQREMVW